MRLDARFFCLMTVCLSLTFPTQAQNKQESQDKEGSIIGENTDNNPTLGMRIILPGSWHLLDKATKLKAENTQTPQDSGCRGPLCGDPDINAALVSKTGTPPIHAIFLGACKLSAPYLNRQRYPLKWFAEAMTRGSLESSDWVPVGDLTSIQVGKRLAYRLMVRDRTIPTVKGFGYVSESNGYVFLLVGSASSNPQDLQSAIEGMRFTNPVP